MYIMDVTLAITLILAHHRDIRWLLTFPKFSYVSVLTFYRVLQQAMLRASILVICVLLAQVFAQDPVSPEGLYKIVIKTYFGFQKMNSNHICIAE